MNKLLDKIMHTRWGWLILVIVLLAINFLVSGFNSRLDLTKEKRYTLSPVTKSMLKKLDEPIRIDVFLEGEFPAGFRKLAKSTNDFLQLLKDQDGSKVQYRFIDPQEKIGESNVAWGDSLVAMGAVPINLTVQKKAGESSNIIFPVAIMHYKNKQELVNLYPGASSRISQEETNNAEALMEYQFVKALDKITKVKKPGIGYNVGNGEPTNENTYDLVNTLSKDYQFGLVDLKKGGAIPSEVNVLMIVKPTEAFDEDEKLLLDQFVMRGGKLLCFIDNLIAEQDSLAFKPNTIAYDRNLNLTDLFFRYGLRINTDLVMDLQCDVIPFVVGGNAENPQFEFLHWNYYPLLIPGAGQSITKNLGYIASRFANSIDTIKVAGVSKTPILVSSANSRIISTPAVISLNENKNVPEDAKFKQNAIPVAMLLEGKFTSLYRNRISSAQTESLKTKGLGYLNQSEENKMIIVADGDIVMNEFLPPQAPNEPPQPMPMGWNRYTYTEYQNQSDYGRYFIPAANREFLLNCIEYLVNDPAISNVRNKEIVLRLLDSKKVQANKTLWQVINIAVPILLVILAGLIYQYIRKRKYTA